MKTMMVCLQRKFGDLGDSDKDASVLGTAEENIPNPTVVGTSKPTVNKGKEKVGEPTCKDTPSPPKEALNLARQPFHAQKVSGDFELDALLPHEAHLCLKGPMRKHAAPRERETAPGERETVPVIQSTRTINLQIHTPKTVGGPWIFGDAYRPSMQSQKGRRLDHRVMILEIISMISCVNTTSPRAIPKGRRNR